MSETPIPTFNPSEAPQAQVLDAVLRENQSPTHINVTPRSQTLQRATGITSIELLNHPRIPGFEAAPRAHRIPARRPRSPSMHIPALALALLASSAVAAPPPAAAPAPAPPSTQTSTSDSGADAKATAEAIVAYLFSTFDDPAAADAPLGPHGAPQPRTSRPASPFAWSDPREQARRQPRGFAVGAFARAEAHASSRSKSSISSALRPGDGRDQASNNSSSSRSRAKATAEARVMVIGPLAAPADPKGDSRLSARDQPSPAERARERSLTQLAATKDWAAAVTTLGQTYLDNPELLSAPIDETVSTLGMSLRELTDRAITLARRENKLAQWITAAALLHADGRTESAKALLAKAKLANPVDAAKLEDFRTTLRIRTTPTTP